MEKVTFVQKAVIINPKDSNKFLLLIRNLNDKSRPGDYDIPGGSVKEGELHEEALIREIQEETSLQVTQIKPVLIDTRIDPETGKYFLYVGYSATAITEKVILNPEEHSDYVWITAKEFKSKTKEHVLLKQIEAIYPAE